MKVAIASTNEAINRIGKDRQLILLWEGCDRQMVEKTSKLHPEAFVVAGVRNDQVIGGVPKKHMTGVIYLNGDEIFGYWKVESDGNTCSYSCGQPCPVWLDRGLAIGVLVCMDVDQPLIRDPVVAAVKASSRIQRFICIPADMGNEFGLADDQLKQDRWSGVNVLFCNIRSDPGKVKSFVSDRNGKKIAKNNDGLVEVDIPDEL
jgi:hypothetical protein